MDNIEKELFSYIASEANKLSETIEALRGYIQGKERSQEIHRSKFRLETRKNIENRIGLSEKSKKQEDTDKMLIDIKGMSINRKPRKDGRYQGYYKIDNDRCYVYGYTVDEVKEKLIKLYNSPKRSKKYMPYKKWLDEWYKLYKQPNVCGEWAKTIQLYINRIADSLGHIRIDKLTTDTIQEYLLSIKQGNTRNKLKQIINGSLEKAYTLRKIQFNPCKALEIKKHRSKSYSPIDISMQDTVYEAITSPEINKLFYLCICTGCRISEAMGLQYSDIDTQNMLITVNKQYQRNNQYKDTTKTYEERTVPILQELLDKINYTDNKKGRIFAKLTYGKVQDYFTELYKKLSINAVATHSLRHTFVSNCYYCGIQDKYIQKWVGHSDITTTLNVYTHIMKKGNSIFIEYIQKLAQDLT